MTIEYENKQFKQIADFPDYYICKETSDILSTKKRMNTLPGTKKILKQTPNSKDPSCNYYVVVLVAPNGDQKKKSVHRLLMETFVPNPDNKAHVNHIDGNKLNNSMDNLEWSTEAENSQHAYSTGLSTIDHCEKEVHQYRLNGTYIQSFKSDAEANRETGVAKQNISKVTLGLRPQAGGYQWSRDKLDSLPRYKGNPIPKELHVLTSITAYPHTFKTDKSISALSKELGLDPKKVSYAIRTKKFYSNGLITITRTYFD